MAFDPWRQSSANKEAKLIVFSSLFLAFIFLSSVSVINYASSARVETPRLAPFNTSFLRCLQIIKEGGVLSFMTPEGYGLGELPPPLNLEHNSGQKIFPPREGYPASYDLRTQDKLTPVKNQGSCGSCWAFASYGSLESFLLPDQYWDFSEQNLIDFHGFDWGPCAGGNYWISTAYLARWSGPIWEQDNPYIYSLGLIQNGFTIRKHVQEVVFIPSRANYLDNDNIKAALMTYGAVYVSMYWDNAYYNSVFSSYYCNLSGTGNNHAVAIVGWDDNFDKNKFNPVPPGNGAFVVRNSWGSSWGEGGYFYLSYYDTRLIPGAVFLGEAPTNFTGVYQYDPLGWVTSFGYGANTAWGANIFSANSSQSLVAVSFYVASANSSYELYLYTEVSSGNPTGGTLKLNQSGTIISPGYHTVALSSPVSLTAGTLFSLVIKLTTPGYNYPIPAEMAFSGYSGGATANAGESFVSSNGSSWYDLSGSTYKANVCLKAFTGNTSPLYPLSGYVRNATGNGLNRVIINGLPSSPQTNIDGYYSDRVPLGWSGSVSPWQPGYTYFPPSRSYSNVNHSYEEQNFFAASGSCSYLIAPTSQSFPATGGLGSVSVTAGSGCSWSALSQASWITITSGSSGSGNGSVNFQVSSQTETGRRLGHMIIAGHNFEVFQEGLASEFSPNNFQIIPEAIWASASGGGTWVTEMQIIDLTGGSKVTAYFYYGGGSFRGPFIIWNNSGGAGRSARFSNLLATLQTVDGAFNYFGKVGAITLSTQDNTHRVLVAARTVNGNYGKTLPALNLINSNWASVGHDMIITNLANTSTYRSFAGFFNPSAYSVTVEFRLYDIQGNTLGSAFTETFSAYDFKSFNIFQKAGASGTYLSCWLKIHPISGDGLLIGFGASANNLSNDPAAHLALSASSGYNNSPSNCQTIPEAIWAAASGGGTWVTEIQIIDMTGNSQVQALFRYGSGSSRGPFTLWTNSGGSGRSVHFTNLLATLDSLDPDNSFSYSGRVGAVDFFTQNVNQTIVVTARTVNGNFGKTFPGLNHVAPNLAKLGQDMILPNLDNNANYRFFAGFYNPTALPLTCEFYLYDSEGNQLGHSFIEDFSAYDFRSFNVFQKAGLTSTYENCWLRIHPFFGTGKLFCFGSSANNTSNDTAAHLAAQR